MMKYLTAAIIGLASPSLAAVEYNDETKSLIISGATTPFMSAAVSKAFKDHDVDTVYMYGPGGSYHDGLYIGRLIKKEGVRVIVPSGKNCVSACAFAAMGADEIMADGKLLYHKPYTRAVSAHATIDQIASSYGVAYIEMVEYFIEMGYGIDFAKSIVQDTNYCTFYVVYDSFDDLKIEDKCE